jgi:hypothetical protein
MDKKTRNDIVKTKDVKQAVEKVVLKPSEQQPIEVSIPEVPQASYRNVERDMQKMEKFFLACHRWVLQVKKGCWLRALPVRP